MMGQGTNGAEAVVLLIRVMISAGFFEAYSELAPA